MANAADTDGDKARVHNGRDPASQYAERRDRRRGQGHMQGATWTPQCTRGSSTTLKSGRDTWQYHSRRGSDVWDTPGVEVAAAAAEQCRTVVGSSAQRAQAMDATASVVGLGYQKNRTQPDHADRSERNCGDGSHRGSRGVHSKQQLRDHAGRRDVLANRPHSPGNGHDVKWRGRNLHGAWGSGSGRGGRHRMRRRTQSFDVIATTKVRPVTSAEQEQWQHAMADYRVEHRKHRRRKRVQRLNPKVSAYIPADLIRDDFEDGRAQRRSPTGESPREQESSSLQLHMDVDAGKESGTHAAAEPLWSGEVDVGAGKLHMYENQYARFLPSDENSRQKVMSIGRQSPGEDDADVETWWLPDGMETNESLNSELDALLDMLGQAEGCASGPDTSDLQAWRATEPVLIPPDPFMTPGDTSNAPDATKARTQEGNLELLVDRANAAAVNSSDSTCYPLKFAKRRFPCSAWSLSGVQLSLNALHQRDVPPQLPCVSQLTDIDQHCQDDEQGLFSLLNDTEHRLATA